LKNSYLTAGTSLPQLLRLFRRNPISYHPKYLLRILFLLQSGFWSSIFGYIENKRFRAKIESSPVPKSPIFIIGHWRSGSTLLHQIMNLDANMLTPTLFQVAEPDCFLTARKYYRPIMKLLLRKNRPMDQVKLGMDEPQEDEYAIYRLTNHSPLERLIFPLNSNYFLKDCSSFVPAGHEKANWENQILNFFKKLNFGKNKTIVSKNPFNSMRIKELTALFPDARFIHIYRHPCDVVPSTMHLWKIVQKQNCLNNLGATPAFTDVIDFLDHILNVIQQDLSFVADENKYILKFEDLEKDPVKVIKDLYSYFRIPFSELFKKDLEAFIKEIEGYQKNQYQLTPDETEQIRNRMKSHMDYFKYQ
jgi:omega-hydroxy-beta-dihydromenaquinone-9 sulfotransferase